MNNYSKARVGLVGGNGYAGRELRQLLARHPGAARAVERGSGRELDAAAFADCDFVFLATPPQASQAWAAALLARARAPRVVDLSGAFRFADAAVYERWYGHAHAAPELLAEAVYGWPEQNRERIRDARLVANPGCYATAALTALWPPQAAGAITGAVICDAKSGASGAGRGLREDLHFVELEGNCKAYSVFAHRHTPEIALHAGIPLARLTFTPHLLPTSRGLLATHYLQLRAGGAERLGAVYAAAYAGHPFVRLRGSELPDLHQVARGNTCDLGWAVDESTGRAVVVSCLDNLIKGAAGQAVQNFNLMSGQAETAGLC